MLKIKKGETFHNLTKVSFLFLFLCLMKKNDNSILLRTIKYIDIWENILILFYLIFREWLEKNNRIFVERTIKRSRKNKIIRTQCHGRHPPKTHNEKKLRHPITNHASKHRWHGRRTTLSSVHRLGNPSYHSRRLRTRQQDNHLLGHHIQLRVSRLIYFFLWLYDDCKLYRLAIETGAIWSHFVKRCRVFWFQEDWRFDLQIGLGYHKGRECGQQPAWVVGQS